MPLPPPARYDITTQDLPDAISPAFMVEKLGLNSAGANPLRHRTWYMQVGPWGKKKEQSVLLSRCFLQFTFSRRRSAVHRVGVVFHRSFHERVPSVPHPWHRTQHASEG